MLLSNPEVSNCLGLICTSDDFVIKCGVFNEACKGVCHLLLRNPHSC